MSFSPRTKFISIHLIKQHHPCRSYSRVSPFCEPFSLSFIFNKHVPHTSTSTSPNCKGKLVRLHQQPPGFLYMFQSYFQSVQLNLLLEECLHTQDRRTRQTARPNTASKTDIFLEANALHLPFRTKRNQRERRTCPETAYSSRICY